MIVLQITQGSVDIDLSKVFASEGGIESEIFNSRLIRTILCLLVGASSACVGLGIQTLFKNPLAGPTTLGINSGASLGVGLFYLLPGFALQFEWIGLTVFACLGAVAFLMLLITAAGRSFNMTFVLIIGLLLSYASYAVLEVLMQLTDVNGMKSYVFWGMGSFNRGSWVTITLILIISSFGFVTMYRLSSWLNIYSLGDSELKLLTKKSVGFNKRLLLVVFGVWIGLITSIVGPIAFVGIVVPNLLKIILKTSDIKKLLTLCMILGAVMVLFADLISRGTIADIALPINAVLSVLGVPVIIYFLLKRFTNVSS